MKRGISPVVGNVLLIFLVVVISIMVFVWSRNFLIEEEKEAMVDKICSSIEFVSGGFCYNSFSIENLATGVFEKKYNLEFGVRNIDEESAIYGFELIFDYDGNSEVIPVLSGSLVEGGETKKINTGFIDNYEDITTVLIVPIIKLGNEMFACSDYKENFDLGDIEEC